MIAPQFFESKISVFHKECARRRIPLLTKIAEVKPKDKGPSVLEQKMLAKAMQTLRDNIIKKQVVMNKVFVGKSFVSKPEGIIFKDFEIGKSYTQKVCTWHIYSKFAI